MADESSFYQRPILNSPYAPPAWHHDLDDDGQPTTNGPKEGRRPSRLITPVPKAKKQSAKQAALLLDDGSGLSTADQEYSRTIVDEVRRNVDAWRALPNPDDWRVTPATRRLLQHWRAADFPGLRPFFCQVEAVETAIWLTEAAAGQRRYDHIRAHLANANEQSNPGLFRLALKMATGSGKTTVMAMLIAWQAINAARTPGSSRYSRGFLIVAPGITIKDRLRVLQPNDTDSYYTTRGLVPLDLLPELFKAKIVITNYHAFRRRDALEVSKAGKALLDGRHGAPIRTLETPGQMLQRVMPDLMGLKNIVVINDEAHHCYREKPGTGEKLTGDDKKDADDNNKAARLWISGLEAASGKLGIRAIYDLSATPFFLRGSGYQEGTLFPWTVSDFSLMDAIESGIVKLPRIPVSDNVADADTLTFRNLWDHIQPMPKMGVGRGGRADPKKLPAKLLQALRMLYGHYAKVSAAWEEAGIDTPPVFIVVCNNTTTSQAVFDWIAGYERETPGEQRDFNPGELALFRNYETNGQRLDTPRTLLIDSVQIESGEAMDKAFRDANAEQIERFKRERRTRLGSADTEEITDEDLLREVMNTVGRPGRLGGSIRCVVSVSMLTEGWDVNTVTHILGVRAFGTQLLCEQVVGRALRRRSYDAGPDGLFSPEYADIFGIPFDFANQAITAPVTAPKKQTHVQALREREALEIVFPRVEGYRTTLPNDRVEAQFTEDSRLVLTPDDTGPTSNENQGIVGESVRMSMEQYGAARLNTVRYELAKYLLYVCFREAGEPPNMALFVPLQGIVRRWMADYLVCRGGTDPSMLLYESIMAQAASRIYLACQRSTAGGGVVRAMLDPFTPAGSTRHVNFNTTKDVFFTGPARCHVNAVVADSAWEAAFAAMAEAHPRVLAYVKNQGLQFEVPYQDGATLRHYRPDFILRLDVGAPEPLNLVLELTGWRRGDKQLKASTMRELWVPGVNALGAYGRWAFAEFAAEYAVEAEFAALVEQFVTQQAAA